jgi:Polysaccharide pyruvyl transferase
VRILIGQPGYDLLNIGDVAMLQSCVARLRQQWPKAEIMVVADDPERLAFRCPGTVAVSRASVPPRALARAVRAADAVVASGGAYVSDTRPEAGAGVLSLLAMAQRFGKPTAMFGQAIGPIGARRLRACASAVLPRLTVLGLREGRISAALALFLGTPPAAIRITGDEALELFTGESVAEGYALGVAGRAGTDCAGTDETAAAIGVLLRNAATFFRAPVAGIPVSPCDPGELSMAVAGCRAIVTGSYHTAVSALAQGVPAVCLARSAWQEAEFSGLAAQFPGACPVVSLTEPDLAMGLRTAIGHAWHMPVADRAAALHAAEYRRGAGRGAYLQFREAVDRSTSSGAPPDGGGSHRLRQVLRKSPRSRALTA